ncbi:MAG: hypothetical protein GDA36_09345 [Rhodobacteraceae bacterium]|nr:hypothetical protein [Paracoccaceae bacterium]
MEASIRPSCLVRWPYLALDRAKRFWWSGYAIYAIVGICGLRVILFVTPRKFCPIAASARLGVRTIGRCVIVA